MQSDSQAERLNHAKAFLSKAQEYLASAEDNLVAEPFTAAAGDAIHAGISAKDAIVTALTGATRKGKDHTTAAPWLPHAEVVGHDAPCAVGDPAVVPAAGVGSSAS